MQIWLLKHSPCPLCLAHADHAAGDVICTVRRLLLAWQQLMQGM